jgi:glycosyltransferase 2 family protein
VALRLAIGAGLVIALLLRTDLDALFKAIREASGLFLSVSLGLVILGLLVNAMRWRVFLDHEGISLRAFEVLRFSLIGTFFNSFLPTGFGGDAYKAIRLIPVGSLSSTVASVLLDRISGLVGIALVGSVGSAALLIQGKGTRVADVAILLGAGVIVLVALAFTLGRRFASSTSSRLPRVRGVVAKVLTAGHDPRTLRVGLGVGVASASVILAVHVSLARALELHVSVIALSGVVVIAALASAIPLTINGLGIREAAYVWSLEAYGASHERALAFALLFLGSLLLSGAIGGIVYLAGGGTLDQRGREKDIVTPSMPGGASP